jgi:hypothetical protein
MAENIPALTYPQFMMMLPEARNNYIARLEEAGALAHRRHLLEAQPTWSPQLLEAHLLWVIQQQKGGFPWQPVSLR